MASYKIELANVKVNWDEQPGLLLNIGFVGQATNQEIVPFVSELFAQLNLAGGNIVLFNGPASLPVAMVLAHAVSHKYQVVACFDPKLSGYVVAISHAGAGGWKVGDLIPAQDVKS